MIETSTKIPKSTKPQEDKAVSNFQKTLGSTKIQRQIYKYSSIKPSLKLWEYLKKLLKFNSVQDYPLVRLPESKLSAC